VGKWGRRSTKKPSSEQVRNSRTKLKELSSERGIAAPKRQEKKELKTRVGGKNKRKKEEG